MTAHDDDPIIAFAVSEVEATRARLRDLEGFLRVYTEFKGHAFTMPAGASAPPQPRPVVPAPPARDRPEISLADRGLSISEAAEKVLRHMGRPMKAREIAETLLDWDYPYDGSVQELRASVGGVLAREVREGGAFTKVRTGTFGLKAVWAGAADIGSDDAEEMDEREEEGGEQGAELDAAPSEQGSGSLFDAESAGQIPTEDAMS